MCTCVQGHIFSVPSIYLYCSLTASVIMPTVESDVDAERVLFSYGFGASVPSTSKRRMQQRSVGVVCAGRWADDGEGGDGQMMVGK